MENFSWLPTDPNVMETVISNMGWLEGSGQVVYFMNYLLVADFIVTPETIAPFGIELMNKIMELEKELHQEKCDDIEFGIVDGKVRGWKVVFDSYWPQNCGREYGKVNLCRSIHVGDFAGIAEGDEAVYIRIDSVAEDQTLTATVVKLGNFFSIDRIPGAPYSSQGFVSNETLVLKRNPSTGDWTIESPKNRPWHTLRITSGGALKFEHYR